MTTTPYNMLEVNPTNPLELALKQRLSDLQAQQSVVLAKAIKYEDRYYSRLFRENNPETVSAKENAELNRKRVNIYEGQITEVRFWLNEMLPTVG